MKRNCPYHPKRLLTMFCSQEDCEAYRLLCIKCLKAEDTKNLHRNHCFIMLEELIKKYERSKSDLAAFGFLTNNDLETATQALKNQMYSMDVLSYYSLQDCMKNISAYEALQKALNDNSRIRPEKLKDEKQSIESKQTTNERTEEKPLKLLEEALNPENSQPTAQSSANEEPISPNELAVTNLIACNFQDHPTCQDETKVSSQMQPLAIDNSLKSPCEKQKSSASKNSVTKIKTSLSAIKNAFCKSTTHLTEKKIKNTSASGSSSKLCTGKKSPTVHLFQHTTSKSPCSKITNNYEKKIDTAKKEVKELENASPFEEANLVVSSTIRKKIQKAEICVSTKAGRTSPDTGLPARPMDQLRSEITRLTSSAWIDLEESNDENVEEDALSSNKQSVVKTTPIFASDVYDKSELEQKALSLINNEMSVDVHDELKKQVTGFKEFASYSQKYLSAKIKTKELKVMWKCLTKKERDQWNSIARRKRIDLREQLETRNKVTCKISPGRFSGEAKASS